MIPVGTKTLNATLDGQAFELYTYRPTGSVSGLLFIFHGNSRNAWNYRDYAKEVADHQGLIVIAPLFDEARFSSSAYHRGNIVNSSGNVRPASEWTTRFVPLFVDWARRQQGAALPYWLWGHSAGGQYLSRVAAYEQPAARRIVVANPSTHVLPLLEKSAGGEQAPYGLGGVFASSEAKLALRNYLRMPVTIYLGGADNDPNDPLLSRSSAADRQGSHRLERGLNTFALGERVARENAARFCWRTVIGPEIAHSGGQMLRSRRVLDALGLYQPAKVYRIGGQKGDVSLRIRMLGHEGRKGAASRSRIVRAA